MDELVTRLVASGASASIFTWIMVNILVNRWLDEQYPEAWWNDLATNGLALFIGLLSAFGLTFILSGLNTSQLIVEAIFVGVAAAGVATLGHEAVKNYRQRGEG